MRVKGTGVQLVASIALLSLAAVVSGCDDDEAVVRNGAAGSAGKGQGGFAGTLAGGASGKGGATGGTAGSSGKGGATGGTAGSSGKGGATGGTAGSSGKGGGTGGTAGSSGKGGTAGSAGASGKGGSGGAPAVGFDPAKTTTLTGPSVTLFDAVPSGDGKTVFFTGLDANGDGAVFSGAPGGTGALLGAANYILPAAVALGTDGATLYVADLGAGIDGTNGSADLKGQVFSVSTAGGAKTVLAGLNGFGVRGLAVRKVGAADELVFSGTDPATGVGGVFKANATTGAAALLSGAAALREPSGVAVVGEDVFAIDAAGPALVRIPASGAAVRTPISVPVGFPAGIAAGADGKTLLLSSAMTTMVFTFDIAAGTFSTTTVDKAAGTEGGGLHKAAAASVYALVDGTAGGTGAVYVLTP